MKERLEPDQLHGLHDAAVADDDEASRRFVALLGHSHQGPQTGGIDEIDAAQIENQGQGRGGSVLFDEVTELTLGIGVELSREMQQQAAGLRLAAAAERDGESGQLGDGSRPPAVDDPEGLSSLSSLAAAGHQSDEALEMVIRVMGAR